MSNEMGAVGRDQPTLTFEVGASGLTGSHFVVSRLIHVAPAMRLLRTPGRAPYARAWLEHARRSVEPARVELLLAIAQAPAWYIPDFLAPIPSTYAPSLDEELAAVAAADPDMVQRQLELTFRLGPTPEEVARTTRTTLDTAERHRAPVPPSVAAILDTGGTAALAERVAAELELVWRVAFEPAWPRICQVLEADILQRGRQLSRQGLAALFTHLGPELSWDGSSVSLDLAPYDASFTLATGPVLAPCVFLDRPSVWLEYVGRRAMFGYPARGRGSTWENPTAASPVPVVGDRRGWLLADLGTPRSTSDLARRHGLSASTTSYHLSLLRQAGLVARHRIGRDVLYERTPRATAVLAALEHPASRRPPGTTTEPVSAP